MKDKEQFPAAEFHRFRWAHANANSFLYGSWFVLLLLVCLVLWILGADRPLSVEVLAAVGAVYALIPRLGFYLARGIFGHYYQPEQFGRSYREYRERERAHK